MRVIKVSSILIPFVGFILISCNSMHEYPKRVFVRINSGILIDDTSNVTLGKYFVSIQLINPTDKNYFISRPGLFSYFTNSNINPYFEDLPYILKLEDSWNDYNLNEVTDSLVNYSVKHFPNDNYVHQYLGGMLFLKSIDTVSFTYTVQKHFWTEFNGHITFRAKHMLEPQRYSYSSALLNREYRQIPDTFMGYEQYMGIVDIDSIIVPIQVIHKSQPYNLEE